MSTLRHLARLLFPAIAGLSVVADAAAQAAPATPTAPLTLQVYNAGPSSFHANAVLVAGKTDAVLLDTGFTRADAARIAAMVLDSGKTLKTIYISQADPDFYFGIDVLKQFFREAAVVATSQMLDSTGPKRLSLPSQLPAWVLSWAIAGSVCSSW